MLADLPPRVSIDFEMLFRRCSRYSEKIEPPVLLDRPICKMEKIAWPAWQVKSDVCLFSPFFMWSNVIYPKDISPAQQASKASLGCLSLLLTFTFDDQAPCNREQGPVALLGGLLWAKPGGPSVSASVAVGSTYPLVLCSESRGPEAGIREHQTETQKQYTAPDSAS